MKKISILLLTVELFVLLCVQLLILCVPFRATRDAERRRASQQQQADANTAAGALLQAQQEAANVAAEEAVRIAARERRARQLFGKEILP